jgi:cell shape-determining protein MreC
MIPDELQSRPIYRRLVPRTDEEMKQLEKIKKKLEAMNNKNKRLSKSVDVSKQKPDIIEDIEIEDHSEERKSNLLFRSLS